MIIIKTVAGVLGLLAACYGAQAAIQIRQSADNELELKKKLELRKIAIEAEEWNKLSTRAILKVADPDLKSYYLKQQEYALIVRDFQALKNTKDSIAMQLVLTSGFTILRREIWTGIQCTMGYFDR